MIRIIIFKLAMFGAYMLYKLLAASGIHGLIMVF